MTPRGQNGRQSCGRRLPCGRSSLPPGTATWHRWLHAANVGRRMPESASRGRKGPQSTAQYRPISLKGLAARFAHVAGVPTSAALPLAVVAFATMSVPPRGAAPSWQKSRVCVFAASGWKQWDTTSDQLRILDSRIDVLRKPLRPPLWMTVEDVGGKRTVRFKRLSADTGNRWKREPELGAFVYQAVEVLEAFGCRLRRRIRDDKAAARAGRGLPRPAAEIVSVLLGIIGLTPNAKAARRRRTAGDGHRGVQTPAAGYRNRAPSACPWFRTRGALLGWPTGETSLISSLPGVLKTVSDHGRRPGSAGVAFGFRLRRESVNFREHDPS